MEWDWNGLWKMVWPAVSEPLRCFPFNKKKKDRNSLCYLSRRRLENDFYEPSSINCRLESAITRSIARTDPSIFLIIRWGVGGGGCGWWGFVVGCLVVFG